jgi:hypothetical protein
VRILVLETLGQLLRLLGAIAVRALELLQDRAEGLNGAARGIETAADRTVRARVCVEEVNEVFLAAGAVVRACLGGSLLEVFDGRVA